MHRIYSYLEVCTYRSSLAYHGSVAFFARFTACREWATIGWIDNLWSQFRAAQGAYMGARIF